MYSLREILTQMCQQNDHRIEADKTVIETERRLGLPEDAKLRHHLKALREQNQMLRKALRYRSKTGSAVAI